MPMLRRKSQVAAKLESVEGTAETIAGADVFKAFGPDWTPNIDPHKRNPVKANMSKEPSVMGKRSATMSFMTELVGSAAGSAIHFAPALKACGVAETLVASTSATYKPASASVPSATLALFRDGGRKLLWGARGNFKLAGVVGAPAQFNFDMTAADFSVIDTALLTTGVNLNDTLPPVFQNATVSIDGFGLTIQRFELNAGNVVGLRKSAAASSGHLSAFKKDREPTITITVENELVGTEDFLGNWRAGALMAFSAAFGSVAGNTMAVTAPALQYQSVKPTDLEGIDGLDITALCCGVSGDDEWQFQIV